jgi:hypothetical protein
VVLRELGGAGRIDLCDQVVTLMRATVWCITIIDTIVLTKTLTTPIHLSPGGHPYAEYWSEALHYHIQYSNIPRSDLEESSRSRALFRDDARGRHNPRRAGI